MQMDRKGLGQQSVCVGAPQSGQHYVVQYGIGGF